MADVEKRGVWIVVKPLRVKRGAQNVLLKIGDQIPEAAGWDNVDYWVARGYLRWLDRPLDAEVQAFVPKKLHQVGRPVEPAKIVPRGIGTKKKDSPTETTVGGDPI